MYCAIFYRLSRTIFECSDPSFAIATASFALHISQGQRAPETKQRVDCSAYAFRGGSRDGMFAPVNVEDLSDLDLIGTA